MNLPERLRRMIDGIPSGGFVMLPVSDVEDWLGDSASSVEPDLTVKKVAELFGRKPQTIRTWIRDRRLDAYRFSGREYRVTRRALEEFQKRERNGAAPERAFR